MKRTMGWKIAGLLLVTAMPPALTGCRSSTGGWSAPSMPTWGSGGGWGWWKGSDDGTALSSAKPSNSVPTPPAPMLAGSGLATGQANASHHPAGPAGTPAAGPTGYPSTGYGAPTAAATPNGYAAAPNPYATRQAAATGESGYYTGPYATGGTQAAPSATNYGAAPSQPYGGQPNYTADLRSGAGYSAAGAGQANTASPYGASAPNAGYPNPSYSNPTPAYGTSGQSNDPYARAPYNSGAATNPHTAPNATAATAAGSSFGNSTVGLNRNAPANSMRPAAETARADAPASTIPAGLASEGGYRPGSTGRAMPAASAEVQRASYSNAGRISPPTTTPSATPPSPPAAYGNAYEPSNAPAVNNGGDFQPN